MGRVVGEQDDVARADRVHLGPDRTGRAGAQGFGQVAVDLRVGLDPHHVGEGIGHGGQNDVGLLVHEQVAARQAEGEGMADVGVGRQGVARRPLFALDGAAVGVVATLDLSLFLVF
ncbi:hypothetical protein D3C80_1849990 [compost metagenome]